MVAIRRHRGLSQQRLADACGIHRAAVAAIEGDKRTVSLGEAIGICAALGVNLAEMVDRSPLILRVETPID